MSHDLDYSTGEPAMAYVGEVPWHRLGERLQPGRSIDEWVKAARLEWKIQMVPVQYPFEGRARVMPERFVLARDDTLETAGALDGGRKVWALAKTGLVAKVGGNAADELGAYVLLATSCDRSIATTATFTSIRVVCQNTLGFAFDDLKSNRRRHIKMDHTQKFDPSKVKEALGLVDGAWSDFMARVNPMAEFGLSDTQALKYFESIFIPERTALAGKPVSNAKAREINQIMSLYKSARGQDLATAKGTLWGAVNAVTHYTDHVRTAKSVERIDSAWFGAGASLKESAWDRASELMDMAAQ